MKRLITLSCASSILFFSSQYLSNETHYTTLSSKPTRSALQISDRDCDIFTLLSKSELTIEEADIIYVERKLYGRLGNNIIAFRKVLREAITTGCHVYLQGPVTKDWDPGWNFLQNKLTAHANSRKSACRNLSNMEWYFFDEFISQLSIAGSHVVDDEFVSCAVDLTVSRYFSVNKTHAFGTACPDENYTALHVRGGDTINGNFNTTTGEYYSVAAHALYGPYPTAYFASVLRQVGTSQNIIVCCEDLHNPTCVFFQKMSITMNNIEVRVAQPLLDDLIILNCAVRIAVSFGTFKEAFMIWRRGKQFHEFSTAIVRNTTCPDRDTDVTYHFIDNADDQSTYNSEIRSTNWKNTAYQRNLVDKSYEIGTHVCKHSLPVFHYPIPVFL